MTHLCYSLIKYFLLSQPYYSKDTKEIWLRGWSTTTLHCNCQPFSLTVRVAAECAYMIVLQSPVYSFLLY